MAATYTTSEASVFGNMRVRTGVLHLNDGADEINFDGMVTVLGCTITPASCATVGMTNPVVINSSAAGYVDFQSFASGDAVNFTVFGR